MTDHMTGEAGPSTSIAQVNGGDPERAQNTRTEGEALQIAGGCYAPVWNMGWRPCRVCAPCKRYEQWSWSRRAQIEAAKYGWPVFATWTFRPRSEHWEPTPANTMVDVKKAIRKLRDKCERLSYLGVFEFGDLRGRTHFHGLFFGAPKAGMTRKVWPQGYTHARWAKQADIEYVAKYSTKASASRTLASFHFGGIPTNDLQEASILLEIYRHFPEAKIEGIGDLKMPYATRSKAHSVLKKTAKTLDKPTIYGRFVDDLTEKTLETWTYPEQDA